MEDLQFQAIVYFKRMTYLLIENDEEEDSKCGRKSKFSFEKI
jgi:hypothetical protein